MRMNVWLVIMGLAAVGCQKEQVCAPGATQACVCAGGGQGAQACSDDGARWNQCACSAAASTGSSAVGTAPAPIVQAGAAAALPAAPVGGSNEATDTVGPKAYTVAIVSADIAPSKPDGRPWDVGDGPPDPVVTVSVQGVGSGTVRSSKVENSTSPKWGQVGRLTLNRGDRLSVTVVDKDLTDDDLVASWDVEFKGPGKQQLKGTSVNSLVLEIAAAK